MSLTIYGMAASRTFRVLWAAQELGVAYDLVPYRFDGPEIRAAPYREINPNAAIPAIVDDGSPLWESLAINLYLARKAGKLWPADLRGEGLTYQWTLFAATEVEPLIGQWFYHTQFLPPEKRKPELVEDAAAKLPKKFDVLEGALAKSPWLAGPAFTIADLNVAAVLFRAPKFGIDPWPHLKDWHTRCTSRPAAMEALKLREKAAAEAK
jgi:glutathione S-transferase